MTVADVFTALGTIIDLVWSSFGSVLGVITTNPLLYVPVLISFGGGIVLFCISMIRKLGVRGVSSAGGKRRGKRRA